MLNTFWCGAYFVKAAGIQMVKVVLMSTSQQHVLALNIIHAVQLAAQLAA
jgi:hypothetical protein